MEVRYFCDNTLEARLPDLAYNDLRDMLPHVGRKELLSMKKLLPDLRPFLCAAQDDISVTVYRNGVYRYQEQGRGTLYSVSLAGRLMERNYASSEEMALTQERLWLQRCQWYWPLIIAGQVRLFSNANKRQYTIRKEVKEKAALDPDAGVSPDCADTVHQRLEEEELWAKLNAAWQTLTVREAQVLYLTLWRKMTQNRVGEKFGILQPSVSVAFKRGIAVLRRAVMEPET